jgi:site-specific recombinase XerD
MNRIKLLFYLKTAKKTKDGSSPIYLRLIVDQQKTEISLKRSLAAELWDNRMRKMKGKSTEATMFNEFLKTVEQQVYLAYSELFAAKKAVTAETLKNHLLGKEQSDKPKHNPIWLSRIYTEHNLSVKELIGRQFAPATYKRYQTSFDHTKSFIKYKYAAEDMDVAMIDCDFVYSYDQYLRTIKKCSHNTTVKYIMNFRKIICICLKRGFIENDPFKNYHERLRRVQKEYLEEAELEAIISKKFSCERLDQVRDIFLFSCYTGLAYIDTKQLMRDDITVEFDGQKWINIRRQKTNTEATIPLLPLALTLIEKYKHHTTVQRTGCILPVLTNQKMNAYLKEISDVCGIKKNLTFHMARHTFATTVTLNNGVGIESVSKMLGHTNLRTTQHYAKVKAFKIGNDMKALSNLLQKKLDNKNNEHFNDENSMNKATA